MENKVNHRIEESARTIRGTLTLVDSLSHFAGRQQQTEGRKVAVAIGDLLAAVRELKNMELEEEVILAEEEIDSKARVLKAKALSLVGAATTSMKEVANATRLPKVPEAAFVAKAKEALRCQQEILAFCGTLELKEKEPLRLAFVSFLPTAMQVYKGTGDPQLMQLNVDNVSRVLATILNTIFTMSIEELAEIQMLLDQLTGSFILPFLLSSSSSHFQENVFL